MQANTRQRAHYFIPAPMIPTTEEQEQTAYFDWLRTRHNVWPTTQLIMHVTNEGKRSHVAGKAKVRAGLVRGVLDIVSLMPRFAIEMKVGDNLPTAEQTWHMIHYQSWGVLTALCWNSGEAIDFTERIFSTDSLLNVSNLSYQQSAGWLRAELWIKDRLQDGNYASPYDPKPVNLRKLRNW